MSNIKEFLDEIVLNIDDNPQDAREIGKKINTNPTQADRNDARLIIQKLRGVPVGKKIDINAERATDISQTDPSNVSILVKNDLDEIVFITETVDGNVIITSISKRRQIMRETILLQRSVQFLKRFLVQV